MRDYGFMPSDELRHVWICYKCHECFIFEDDKDEHVRTTGHKELGQYDTADILDGYRGTNMQHSEYRQADENSKW